MAFLGKGQKFLHASPTFDAPTQYARATGGEVVSVPLDPKFSHNLDVMLLKADPSTTLVYVCNPNNPTGSITPREELEHFFRNLHSGCYIVIDEAYHHYAIESARYASFIDHPIDLDRVIVSRSFSIAYGLAGLRIGYCISSPETIRLLQRFMTIDSVNVVAANAAIAALDDGPGLRSFIAKNASDRQEFFNQAMARMLKPIDSHCNFVMMNTYRPAGEVIETLREDNIVVAGPFSELSTYIRVSLGSTQEMLAFWKAWDKLPSMGGMHH
jgi:histidinol-phosphate aminotransferase